MGLLGYQHSVMMDVVVLILIFLIPLIMSACLFAKKNKYKTHSRLMVGISTILAIVVALFEIDIRLNDGIEGIASKANRIEYVQTAFFKNLLYTHLFFAISCLILWSTTIVYSLKKFNFKDPKPNSYSKLHKILAWTSIIDLVLVTITGLLVYYYAFIER